MTGNFTTDRDGNPQLSRGSKPGEYKDKDGNRVNKKGYLIDQSGNVIDKNGDRVFNKEVLEPDGNIPKVFRQGLP